MRGGFTSLGPGAIWYRANRPIVEGAGLSQVMRAVIAADFSNGSSPVLSFDRLDLPECRPHREPVTSAGGRLDPAGFGESWIGPDGAGLAASKLADINGYFGRAVQSLVIEKR
jgi:hypothetical protein